ncbi:hypothetical protein IWX49DRAFT_569673 [Phyllosticta citricarpa]
MFGLLSFCSFCSFSLFSLTVFSTTTPPLPPPSPSSSLSSSSSLLSTEGWLLWSGCCLLFPHHHITHPPFPFPFPTTPFCWFVSHHMLSLIPDYTCARSHAHAAFIPCTIH